MSRDFKEKEEQEQIKNIIRKFASRLPLHMKIEFDNSDINSRFGFTKVLKIPTAIIGIRFEKDFTGVDYSFETKLTISAISLYHEYRHLMQYKKVEMSEIEVSKKMWDVCYGFNDMKYEMLPQELDAEIWGILKAEEMIKNTYPTIDFEKCVLEYVNNASSWYGPESSKEKRHKFSSYQEVLEYLIDNKEICYNFPSKFEYSGFLNKNESIRVSELKDGAEQIYLIMKDACSKRRVAQKYVDAAKEYKEYYCETIDDIQLNIPKENTVDSSSFLKFENDVGKGELEYEDR